MSKIALTPNASGTGTLTIAAPNTSTDRTLTLPDETGTVLSDISNLAAGNLTGTIASARMPAGSVVQYVANKLTGTASWTHSAYDVWKHVVEVGITPKLTNSTLYARAVWGGYAHSNGASGGRGDMIISVHTSTTGNSFAYQYGGTSNIPGTGIARNMVAQDSTSTAGTICTQAFGSFSNTNGATRGFIFSAAMQDQGSGTLYINQWNVNESFIEVWEVA